VAGIWVRLCTALGVLLTLDAALAAKTKSPEKPDNSMRFALVRVSADRCEPTCPEWIWASGDITQASVGRLKAILAEVGKRKLPIMLTSYGGDVRAAMEMGRIIRKRKLDVAVAGTRFTGCAPSDKTCKPDPKLGGAYAGVLEGFAPCASACHLILAGGVHRFASSAATVGVHQVTSTITHQRITYRTQYKIVKGKKRLIRKDEISRKNTGTTTTEMSKGLRTALQTYYREMDIRPTLTAMIEDTPAAGIRWLTPQERTIYNLTTSAADPITLVDTGMCRTFPAPNNCRLLTEDDVAAVSE